jgi:hypothetical protein
MKNMKLNLTNKHNKTKNNPKIMIRKRKRRTPITNNKITMRKSNKIINNK